MPIARAHVCPLACTTRHQNESCLHTTLYTSTGTSYGRALRLCVPYLHTRGNIRLCAGVRWKKVWPFDGACECTSHDVYNAPSKPISPAHHPLHQYRDFWPLRPSLLGRSAAISGMLIIQHGARARGGESHAVPPPDGELGRGLKGVRKFSNKVREFAPPPTTVKRQATYAKRV